MSRIRLSETSLDCLNPGATRYRYDRGSLKPGIVHLGPGAFHRAHQASYTDSLLEQLGGDWGIVEVSIHSAGTRDRLLPQDNLYTLCSLGRETGFHVVGCISETLVAPEDPAAVIDRLSRPATQAVTLTITEKGYCLTPEARLDFDLPDIQADLARPTHPKTAIGYLVAGLNARRENGQGGIPVISCDNLTDNGSQLKAGVLDFAGELDPALARWIEDAVSFPCTMVDSITPKTEDSTRELVERKIGLYDATPIQREPFLQWVIEDLPGCALPPWQEVGVEISNNVGGWELTKHRILNGLHSAATFMGLSLGLESVEEAVTDPRVRPFLEDFATREILPSLPKVPGLDKKRYLQETLDRFENPGIRHELAQIAWDTTKKLPYRILGTLEDNLQAGRPTGGACKVLAAWMAFVRRRALAGERIFDPLAERLESLGRQQSDSAADLSAALLALQEVFPERIAADAGVRAAVQEELEALIG